MDAFVMQKVVIFTLIPLVCCQYSDPRSQSECHRYGKIGSPLPGVICGGFQLEGTQQCPPGYECVGEALAWDGPGVCCLNPDPEPLVCPDGRQPTGESCDGWPGEWCDQPRLTVCITNPGIPNSKGICCRRQAGVVELFQQRLGAQGYSGAQPIAPVGNTAVVKNGYDKDNGNCLPGGSIFCGPNAECVGQRMNICKCKDGYPGGDPYSATGCYCTLKCGVNAHCEGPVCKCDKGYVGNPNKMCFYGYCGGRTCGANAHCLNRQCVCDAGSTGDPYLGCTAICGPGERTCGHNAHCDAGTCVCNRGYFGDFPATWGCSGPCRDRFCGYNATCVNDVCTCIELHVGNASYPYGCFVPESRQCGGKICGLNAFCVDKVGGICKCVSDHRQYVGDPYTKCTETYNCGNAPCGPNAYCVEPFQYCVCDAGFTPHDGVCQRGCYGKECGPKQDCNNSLMKCKCMKNYKLDQARENCVYSPELCGGDDYCGALAVCKNNVCQCPTGYIGNPNVGCSKPATA